MTDSEGKKKAFVAPHLIVYGDIQQVTQAIKTTGAMDTGGMGQMTKTR